MNSFFEGNIWPLRGKLFRMAYLWVKDRALAEDILQNVFEKSFRKEDELQQHPNLTGWLIRSLKNEALMHFRKTGKIVSLDENGEARLMDPEPERSETKIPRILQLVNRLPEKQRQIFQLREMEGLTYEEVAEYLEIPMEQVKVNLHRARKKLREEFAKQETKS
ncbi:RNA polymerase sigma factor [Algoriphagus kandeliae]|uniref:RNA polymerase sigma factor n=1 Tax=Algoriphagus kandeliae TaxID=2562278 RepID=A0A4Y9QMR5_9BACT|nr:RNA polymerase sigma factor [Algoriphagus kandeliae]TFV93520.1 RNA polymerase sigma factor [Algoriphagus kandeliae]